MDETGVQDNTESSDEVMENELYEAEKVVSDEAAFIEAPIPEETPVVIEPEIILYEYGMTEQQRNSFSMLYHLAITAEEIRISKGNRLLLDEIYTSLLNDINPGAIDETTQAHLQNLRDIIKSYINISVKRDRLQYIHNQKKAANIRSAVPNPIAVLSMTKSLNWKKLVLNAVYTIGESFVSYLNASDATEQEFLMSGWELDDEETAAIQKNRDRAFDYMVDMVQEYKLDGLLTLNEKAIQTFAEICTIDSVYQKIRRFETEEETYKLLGNYWLELADAYYETSQYDKCLDCVDRYNNLAMGIYRQDFNYVKILPKAIVAAQEIYSGDEYIAIAEAYANSILQNTGTEEWSVRYFAAQVYLDLYSKTYNRDYLEKAYNIAYDNITILLDEQRAINSTYLADFKEIKIEKPDYRYMTKDEQKKAKKEFTKESKRLKAYNKELKENRKTELPPLYEPLILNCELLFALADKMEISDTEKLQIEAILQTETNGVFLSKVVNDKYSFTPHKEEYSIEFTKDGIIIPANLLTDEFTIKATVTDNDGSLYADDCVVNEIIRKNSIYKPFSAFIVSEKLKKYPWTENSKVKVEITVCEGTEPIVFSFKVKEYTKKWLFSNKVVFEKE